MGSARVSSSAAGPRLPLRGTAAEQPRLAAEAAYEDTLTSRTVSQTRQRNALHPRPYGRSLTRGAKRRVVLGVDLRGESDGVLQKRVSASDQGDGRVPRSGASVVPGSAQSEPYSRCRNPSDAPAEMQKTRGTISSGC